MFQRAARGRYLYWLRRDRIALRLELAGVSSFRPEAGRNEVHHGFVGLTGPGVAETLSERGPQLFDRFRKGTPKFFPRVRTPFTSPACICIFPERPLKVFTKPIFQEFAAA